DVPYFAVAASGRDVLDGEGQVLVAGRFESTPFARLLARLRALSPDDRERQAATIRATFLARATGLAGTPAPADPPPAGASVEPGGLAAAGSASPIGDPICARRSHGANGSPSEDSAPPFDLPCEPLPRAAGLDLALEIAEDLVLAAVRGPGGTATWIALSPLDDSGVCQVRPIGYNLHSGAAGVGLFLAALARTTGEARYEELARAALREV